MQHLRGGLTASSVVAADLVVVAFKPTSHLKATSKSFPPLFGFLLIKFFVTRGTSSLCQHQLVDVVCLWSILEQFQT
jgi:hypothetical protein